MYKIKLLPEALKDWQQAYDYHEDLLPGLGDRFSREIVKRIEELNPFPKHKIVFEGVRCINIRKFRYRIHFTINETNKIIRIVAFFHASQDPKVWDRRK